MQVLLYADEPILSDALSVAFGRTNDINLVRVVRDAKQILPQIQQAEPDLALLTVTPELHLSTLTEVREFAPKCRIVLWAHFYSQEIAFQVIELGIRGILSRTSSMELLLKCLRKVHEGELWFDRQLALGHMNYHRVSLTLRQAQLAELVAEGHNNKEISETLSLSEGAVKVYLSHLFEKLGTKDRNELAQLVIRNVRSDEPTGHIREASGDKVRSLFVANAAPKVALSLDRADPKSH